MERTFGPWTVRIDRTLCVGFGDCIAEAGDVFELDDEGLARFRDGAPPAMAQAVLEAACRSCPVDALTLHDAAGAQVAP